MMTQNESNHTITHMLLLVILMELTHGVVHRAAFIGAFILLARLVYGWYRLFKESEKL